MRADFLAERAERGFAPAARPLEPPPPKPPISIPAPAPSNDGDTSPAAGKAVQGDALVPHEDAAAAPGSGRRTDSGDDIAAAVSSEAAGSAELCDGAQIAESKLSLRRSTSSVRSLRRLDSTVKDSPEVRRLRCTPHGKCCALHVASCWLLRDGGSCLLARGAASGSAALLPMSATSGSPGVAWLSTASVIAHAR